MKACEELTVELSQGTSEVAMGCVVCCCSCANTNHCSAKALAFGRLSGPAVGVRIGTRPVLTSRMCSVIMASLFTRENADSLPWKPGLAPPLTATGSLPACLKPYSYEWHRGQHIDGSLRYASVIVSWALRQVCASHWRTWWTLQNSIERCGCVGHVSAGSYVIHLR